MLELRWACAIVTTGFSVFALAGCSSGSTIPAGLHGGAQSAAIRLATHNKWSSGVPLPSAVLLPAVGAIGTKIYVAGGATATKIVTAKLQIYDTATKTWSTGAPMHTARWDLGSGAVVNGILYVVGGATTISKFTNGVEAYDPTTNTWTRKKAMPIANAPVVAAVGTTIYAIGGYDSATGQRLASVYAYDTTSDTWSKRASMIVAKSNPGVGVSGATIVVADGYTNSNQDTTDNEAYGVRRNSWTTRAADLTATTAPCSAAINGNLILAGGESGGGSAPAQNTVDAYALQGNKWSAKATMPQAVVGPGSAVVNGKLFCIGGASLGNPRLGGVVFYNNVQVYQP